MRRRLLRAVAHEDPDDITTVEDEGSVEKARQDWHQMREELESGG